MTPTQHRTIAQDRAAVPAEQATRGYENVEHLCTVAHAHLAGASGQGPDYAAAEAHLAKAEDPTHQPQYRVSRAYQAIALAIIADR